MTRLAQIRAVQAVRLFALVPCLVAAGALLSHALGRPLLPWIRAEYRSMSAISGAGLLLLGLALLAYAGGRHRLCKALGIGAGALLLSVLASMVLFGEDQVTRRFAGVLFPASTWSSTTSRTAATGIVLLAASLLLDHRPRAADALSAIALVLSLNGLLGYAYGVHDLAPTLLFNNMALATALALFLLSIGVFCTRHDSGWASIVASSYAAGGATRRQLLLLVWTPVVGGAAMLAVDAGRLDTGAAMALVVIATVIPMALLILRDGRRQLELDEGTRSRDIELARVAAEAQHRLLLQSEELRAESAERAKAEALVVRAQRLEVVGQLTGGIAHDFNNLLMAVSGNVQLLERRLAPDDPALRFVGNLRNVVAKGTKVTQQLLAFARSQRLNIRPTSIAPVLQSARELIGHSLGPNIAIRVQPCPTELWAMCDPDQLELSILNLAVNSRDAMPGGGTIEIDCSVATLPPADPGEPELPCVRVRVVDNGVGMQPEVASHAVEPFFTTKERGKGTGLGLAQVYGFVMQCQGDFRLTTEPGLGTTIELRFPRVEAPVGLPLPVAAAPEPAPIAAERHRVLVIDDDPAVRDVIAQALSQAGYLVTEAHDGASGLESLAQAQPAAAVIDFLMPGLNGAEVAKIARDRHPGLPIIFVSGYSDTIALDGILDASVLRKPFEVQTLTRMVEAAIVAG